MGFTWTLHSGAFHDAPETSLRIGALGTFWAKPLTEGLEHLEQVRFIEDTPKNLAERLIEEELDCALLSPLDAVRVPFSRAIPGIGVATAGPGPCQSLFTHEDPARVRRLAVEPQDGAMVGLAQVVLSELQGTAPEFIAVPFETLDPRSVDGIVLSATRLPSASWLFRRETDLCERWEQLTALPFIHALWVARPRTPHAALRRILTRAVRQGLERLETTPSPEPGLRAVHYTTGSGEMDGLRMFLRLAAKHHFCPENAGIELC